MPPKQAVKEPAKGSASSRIGQALEAELSSLPPGSKFPPVRELVSRFGASALTVHRAVAVLVREGRLVTRPGDGTYVAARTKEARTLDLSWQTVALGSAPDGAEGLENLIVPPRPHLIQLGTGYTDSTLQPLALLHKATARAAADGSAWGRVTVEGREDLRAWFARDVGGEAQAQNVMIVPGGQAALSTVLRTLVGAGGALITESPTYFGMIAIAKLAGVKTIPVPTDEEGIRVDLLEQALNRSRAKVIYLQPTYGNPTGVCLSPERRARVLELAAQKNAFIIEDDYARDLGTGAPPAPMARNGEGRVIYVRSLTKTGAPGLRVAAIVAFGPVLARLRGARAIDDFFVAGLMQAVAAELVSSPGYALHLRRLSTELAVRRRAALDAIARHLPEAVVRHRPTGGFSLWVELPKAYDDAAVVREAERLGVHVVDSRPWFTSEPHAPHLRMSVAAANAAAIEEGVRLLGEALRTTRGERSAGSRR
jgi:DNA-binding transcriptional MocR family regulator